MMLASEGTIVLQIPLVNVNARILLFVAQHTAVT